MRQRNHSRLQKGRANEDEVHAARSYQRDFAVQVPGVDGVTQRNARRYLAQSEEEVVSKMRAKDRLDNRLHDLWLERHSEEKQHTRCDDRVWHAPPTLLGGGEGQQAALAYATYELRDDGEWAATSVEVRPVDVQEPVSRTEGRLPHGLRFRTQSLLEPLRN